LGKKIAILGFEFKKYTGDMSETPAINVCKGILGDSDGVCVLNVWDEYKKLDYQKIYDNMRKPSFVFYGRNVVDCNCSFNW